jgi:cytochrome c oxidase subunit 1
LSDIFIQGEVLHYQESSLSYWLAVAFLGHPRRTYIVLFTCIWVLPQKLLQQTPRKPIFGYRAMIASILAMLIFINNCLGSPHVCSGMNPFFRFCIHIHNLVIAIPSAFNYITTTSGR